MHTIEFARIEIEKHRNELLTKSKLDEKSFNYLMDYLFSKIDIVKMNDIAPFKDKAIEIMNEIDIDDAPFIALAMYVKCPIWSNDRHFKKQGAIKAYTTNELISLL